MKILTGQELSSQISLPDRNLAKKHGINNNNEEEVALNKIPKLPRLITFDLSLVIGFKITFSKHVLCVFVSLRFVEKKY